MAPPPSFISPYYRKQYNASVCLFPIQKDGKIVECGKVIKQGKQKGGTSNLHAHAKKDHPDEYNRLKSRHEEAKAKKLGDMSKLTNMSVDQISNFAAKLNLTVGDKIPIFDKNIKKQLTLESCVNGQKPLKVDDPSIQHIHKVFAEMCISGARPIDLCNDIGMVRLCHTLKKNYILPSADYLKTHTIPDIEQRIGTKKKKIISEAVSVALTCDIWSANSSPDSFLGVTLHSLNAEFNRETVVLACPVFETGDNRHTGLNISTLLNQTIEHYGIPKEKIFVVVSDNASNMVAGIDEFGVTWLSCFLHTLALIVKHSVLEQASVKKVIDKCRTIVQIVKDSPVASIELRKIQADLEFPEHRLLQVTFSVYLMYS